jgi:hypothetical protein
MRKIRTKSNAKKKEITLKTMLAKEATSDSRKLLKKHGLQDANDHDDLETKLARLYLDSSNKISLEKEMAQIHPHKKWLEKYIEPKIEIQEKIIEIKAEPEKKSNADGDVNCKCSTCRGYSQFTGALQQPKDYIGVIGIVAVTGILLYVISKDK